MLLATYFLDSSMFYLYALYASICRAALCPGYPETPPPGCDPDPHMNKPWMGVL